VDVGIIELFGEILQCCSEHQSCDIITQRNCLYLLFYITQVTLECGDNALHSRGQGYISHGVLGLAGQLERDAGEGNDEFLSEGGTVRNENAIVIIFFLINAEVRRIRYDTGNIRVRDGKCVQGATRGPEALTARPCCFCNTTTWRVREMGFFFYLR
jgi:hypothetical protein